MSLSRRYKFSGLCLVIVTAMSLTITACTDREIAAGAVGVIVGIGIGSDNSNDRVHQPPPRYRERCGRYERCRYSLSESFQADESVVGEEIVDFAHRYQLSFEVAGRFRNLLSKIGAGDTASIRDLGVSIQSLVLLMQGESNLSDTEIRLIALKLGTDEGTSIRILSQLAMEMRSQSMDQGSRLWNHCVSAGNWKTPENPSCSNLSWEGCSVATGATTCIAQK